METMTARYLARPTDANASRLVAYMNRHQFAGMLATPLHKALIEQARAQIVQTKQAA